jgi:hypothetical protein
MRKSSTSSGSSPRKRPRSPSRDSAMISRDGRGGGVFAGSEAGQRKASTCAASPFREAQRSRRPDPSHSLRWAGASRHRAAAPPLLRGSSADSGRSARDGGGRASPSGAAQRPRHSPRTPWPSDRSHARHRGPRRGGGGAAGSRRRADQSISDSTSLIRVPDAIRAAIFRSFSWTARARASTAGHLSRGTMTTPSGSAIT